MAKVALAKQDSGDPFYTAKLATARFYFAKLLPETAALIRTRAAGVDAADGDGRGAVLIAVAVASPTSDPEETAMKKSR